MQAVLYMSVLPRVSVAQPQPAASSSLRDSMRAVLFAIAAHEVLANDRTWTSSSARGWLSEVFFPSEEISTVDSLACFWFMGRVVAGAQQVERNIWLVPHNPAIVPWGDVEDVSGLYFDDAAIIHGCSGAARDH